MGKEKKEKKEKKNKEVRKTLPLACDFAELDWEQPM